MKRTLPGIFLAIATLLVWLTFGQGKTTPTTVPTDSLRITESYLDSAERWTYDTRGVRNQIVHVDSGVKYTDAPTTFLTGLVVEGPDHDGRYWHMTAGRGELNPQRDVLQLLDGVSLRESEGDGLLTTPDLRVFMASERATTASSVKLKLRSSTTTARGLELNLREGTAQLLNDVETLYVR